METIMKNAGLIKLGIFIVSLTLGLFAGSLLDQVRIGIFFGIALGLTGITGFLYYTEWLVKQREKQRNSAIPIVDIKIKKRK